MIGFIKKDLAMIKSNFKILGGLIILYAIMGLVGELDVSFILPFISVMIMISTFSYDSYNKFDAYSITLPDGRKNSVKSKYGTTILLIFVISIVSIILSFIISYTNTKSIDYAQIFFTMLGNIFGTLLVLSVMYPIIYKFGIEKARIVICIIIFGIAILGGFLLQYIDLSFIAKSLDFLENYLAIILILIAIFMVLISYKISEKILLKKEY